MEMQATRMSRGVKSVTLEYDGKGGRVRKTLTDGAARRLYATLLKGGKNPKIVGAER